MLLNFKSDFYEKSYGNAYESPDLKSKRGDQELDWPKNALFRKTKSPVSTPISLSAMILSKTWIFDVAR